MVTKLKTFEGDFLAGLNRTQDLFVGLSEGLAANPALRVEDVVRLLTKIHARFGQFLATDEVNAVKLKKIENETDEAFFRTAHGLEKARHEATYKVQDGAAAGKAICKLTSQDRVEAQGK